MFTLFKIFMKPVDELIDSVTTPLVFQSSQSTQNMQNITSMFNAMNITAQTMIHMNVTSLATVRRLSDDIGTMADRIGMMADRIEETEVLQSVNFLAVQTNTIAPAVRITDSDIFTIMTSNVVSTITVPYLPVENTIDGSDLASKIFASAPNSNAAQMASMFISFSETMNSMININADYINTTIKLGNDIGKMTVRIGQMADKIVDTMVIQSNNLKTMQNNLTNGTIDTNSTNTTETTPSGVVDTTVSAPHITSSLTTAATDIVTTILDMTTSFNTMMGTVASAAANNNDTIHGMVELFNAANDIVRYMVTLNAQFLTTVLSLSDEIGTMADRIGDMADQIVTMQKVFTPLYLASHDVNDNVDASEASLTALNGSLHVGTDSINIFLDSITAVSGVSSMTMPVSMETIGDMTALFIIMLKGFATTDMGMVDMDEITAMFATANETVQMMMGINDQYQTAILRLSDDIGIMADRIGVMADRIIETQEIQSENFLATYHDALSMMLIGDVSINTLNGGTGADTLDGKNGADTMNGGSGNDTYYVDNTGDVIVETSSVTTEIDTVHSTISYTLGANVENLVLFGHASINGTGNSLNNILQGNDNANTLSGGAGSDILDGREGADTMIGGTGNDTYYVDNAGDVVTETTTSTTEIDTLISSIDYTLGNYVENLTLSGTANINGTGNGLNNLINGNIVENILNGGSGNDTIDGKSGGDKINGGAGNDILIGGAGNDIFVFDTAPSSYSNRDTITDFTSGSDMIELENAVFTKLSILGTLSADNFNANMFGVAGDFNDYLIYNTSTGVLSYDADGIGIFYGQVQIAVLGTSSHPSLSASDICII